MARTLIYRAGFASRAMIPEYDLLSGLPSLPARLLSYLRPPRLHPLRLTQSSFLPSNTLESRLEMQQASTETGAHSGARISVERRGDGPVERPDIWPDDWPDGSEEDQAYFGLVVHPLPDLDQFEIVATFEQAAGPSGRSDTWACAVQARKEGASRDPTNEERITVTLQSRWNDAEGMRGARMNAPGSSVGNKVPHLDQRISDALFSGDPHRSRFTLELRVDRKRGVGRAKLTTTFYLSVNDVCQREFWHPLTPTGENRISTAGVFIAVAGGTGPASVTVTELSIYKLRLGFRDWLGSILSITRNGRVSAGPQ